MKGDKEITDIVSLNNKILSYLAKKNKRGLITIDDVSDTPFIKTFIFAYQQYVRANYPVSLLMSGLYENITELANTKGLTFLHRAPKLYLGPLNLTSIAMSYKKLLKIGVPESATLAKLTKGYAYGYQLLGSLVYKKGLSEETLEEYDQKLSENAYSLMWERFTDKEKDILIALSEGLEQKEIAQSLHLSNGAIQVYKKRLTNKGAISRLCRGKMEFALPRFKEFVAWQKLLQE